jgi:hypothetical protein
MISRRRRAGQHSARVISGDLLAAGTLPYGFSSPVLPARPLSAAPGAKWSDSQTSWGASSTLARRVPRAESVNLSSPAGHKRTTPSCTGGGAGGGGRKRAS